MFYNSTIKISHRFRRAGRPPKIVSNRFSGAKMRFVSVSVTNPFFGVCAFRVFKTPARKACFGHSWRTPWRGGSIINITPCKFHKNESVTQTFYHKDFSNFKRNIFGQKLSERPFLNRLYSAVFFTSFHFTHIYTFLFYNRK